MMQGFILKIRRGETPFYRTLRDIARTVRSSTLPLPRFLNPVLSILFDIHNGIWRVVPFLVSYFYREPLFRGRCSSIGKRFRLFQMPYVVGQAKIVIGDDVNFFGGVFIMSGRMFDEPRLIIGDRVDIGHNVGFVVNKEIVIEEDVNVATGVRFMDSDSHPRDTAARIADMPPLPEEIKPVRVCRYAWIGQNSFILKGVTIGEGAIIGVNSVVVTDIPPYTIAMGNPARVVVKNMSAAKAVPTATPGA
jgi:acetyltransferase-like isoleucine patch superfamily enzyme